MQTPESYDEVLNSIENITLLNLLDVASMLNSKYSSQFVAPRKGIYITGEVDPCMVDGVQYYEVIKNSNTAVSYVPLVDIEKTTNAIASADGRIVIPLFVMKNKAQWLTNEPTVPAVAVKYVYHTLMNEIMKKRKYNNIRDHENKANELLVSGAEDLTVDSDDVMRILRNELNLIDQLIRDKSWHMFFSKLVGTQMHIEQGSDWRVLEYYRITQKEDDKDGDHDILRTFG